MITRWRPLVLPVAAAALAFALGACGYKGPLAVAEPAAAGSVESLATSRAPDAESAALPSSRDADEAIDDSQDADPRDDDP